MLRNARFPLLLLLASAVAAETPSRHVARPGPEATPELRATVEDLDRQLFAALFDRCDVAALRGLVADDLEFFHDKHGQTARNSAQFLDTITAMCARQASGEDYRARRELDPASSEVFPMQGYGALHTGVHRFYMLQPGQPGERMHDAPDRAEQTDERCGRADSGENIDAARQDRKSVV